MCVYSMIADHVKDNWWKRVYPETPMPDFTPIPWQTPVNPPRPLSDEEVDDIRKLLERAKKYDKENNEPNCELEVKKDLLRKLAKEMGVELDI